MTKTYRVWDRDGEGGVVVVRADTRGKARFMGASDMSIDQTEWVLALRVGRVPELDGKQLTEANIWRAGAYGWVECISCGSLVYWPDGAEDYETGMSTYFIPEPGRPGCDRVWCSEQCCEAYYRKRRAS